MTGAWLRLEWRLLMRSRMGWLSFLLFALIAAATAASVHTWSHQLRSAPSAAADKVDGDLRQMRTLMDDIEAGRKQPSDVDTYDDSQGEFVPDLRDPFVTGFYRPQLAAKAISPLAALAVGAGVSLPSHFVITSRPLN